MELKNKEITFRKLQQQIKENSKSIDLYKRWIPVLMLLFIAGSFITFYFKANNILNTEQFLFVGVLIIVFLILTRFHLSILKMKKENRSLDTKIYNLLKL